MDLPGSVGPASAWGMYLNTGGQFVAWGRREVPYLRSLPADLTGDGVVDFLGSRPGAPGQLADLWIAKGNGDNTWDDYFVLAAGVGGLREVIDLDLDGDLDLNTSEGIYMNIGAGQFRLTGPNQFLSHFVDLDGDGHLDAIGQPGQGQAAEVYLGDGTGKFNPTGPGSIHASFTVTVAYGFWDLDGDGYPELLCAEQGSSSFPSPKGDRLVVLSNDGKGRFLSELWSKQFPWLGGVGTVRVGDADRDGDDDLFLEYRNPSHGTSIMLLQNDGAAGFNDVSSTHLPPHRYQTYTGVPWDLVDVDSDGDLDILASGKEGTVEIWENDGTGHMSVTDLITVPRGMTRFMFRVADLDRDGDPDIYGEAFPLAHSLLWGLTRHLHFDGMIGNQAKLTVFNTSDKAAPRSVWPLVSTSLLSRPLPIPGLGLLGIDVSNAVLLPPAVIPAGQGSVDMMIPIPLSAVVSGTRFSVQAAIQGVAGWGLTNVERMVLVY